MTNNALSAFSLGTPPAAAPAPAAPPVILQNPAAPPNLSAAAMGAPLVTFTRQPQQAPSTILDGLTTGALGGALAGLQGGVTVPAGILGATPPQQFTETIDVQATVVPSPVDALAQAQAAAQAQAQAAVQAEIQRTIDAAAAEKAAQAAQPAPAPAPAPAAVSPDMQALADQLEGSRVTLETRQRDAWQAQKGVCYLTGVPFTDAVPLQPAWLDHEGVFVGSMVAGMVGTMPLTLFVSICSQVHKLFNPVQPTITRTMTGPGSVKPDPEAVGGWMWDSVRGAMVNTRTGEAM